MQETTDAIKSEGLFKTTLQLTFCLNAEAIQKHFLTVQWITIKTSTPTVKQLIKFTTDTKVTAVCICSLLIWNMISNARVTTAVNLK